MRICHVTPHLPPDQAANALLPFHLGCWARDAGDDPFFIAHPPPARAGRRPADRTARPCRAHPTASDRERRRPGAEDRERRGRLAHREDRRPAHRRRRHRSRAQQRPVGRILRQARRARGQAGRPDALRHRDLALPPQALRPGPVHGGVSGRVGRHVLQPRPARLRRRPRPRPACAPRRVPADRGRVPGRRPGRAARRPRAVGDYRAVTCC